jgi:hypothetical protein
MNYLQVGLVMDPLITPVNIALATYVAWLTTLETFMRDIGMSINPSGLSAVKLFPKIIFYVASCITEGIFNFLQRRQ